MFNKYVKYKHKYLKLKNLRQLQNAGTNQQLYNIEYPYYKYMYELNVDNVKNIVRNYHPVIINYVPHKFRNRWIDKYNGHYFIIVDDWEKNSEINNLTDYFTEPCRVRCSFWNNITPFKYWNKNKNNIISDIDSNMSFVWQIYEAREKLFKKVKMCTNFKVSVAIAVLQHFRAKRWLDISAGWGDRLLSAALCGLDVYVGVDPNPCLHQYYGDIIDTFGVDPEKYTVLEGGFEDVEIPKHDYDIVFSSPPFFDVEKYSESTSDSITRYNTGDNWYNYFLIPSLNKAISHIIKGGHLVLYMSDGKNYKFMDKMISYVNTKMKLKGAMYYYFRGSNNLRRFLVWIK